MTSESKERVELLQGTLDLIVLRALHTMGAQHAYGLAARRRGCQAAADRGLTMSSLRRSLLRLVNACRPWRAEPDLDREMASHLRLLEDDFQRRGLSVEE